MRDIGVTPMQASAIMALRRDGPLSQAMLGRAIGMEPANVHGLVARLRKQRLVRTAAHPTDQRAVRITLTAAGERHASAVAHISAASAEATLQPLSPDERVVFLALLRRVASGIS